MRVYVNTCCSGHRRIFRGLFAQLRCRRWWVRHDLCECADGVTR